MKHPRRLIVLMVIAVAAAVLIYLVKNATASQNSSTALAARLLAEPPAVHQVAGTTGAFRIDMGKHELYILAEDSYTTMPLLPDKKNSTEQLSLFNVFTSGDTTALYSDKNNTVYFRYNRLPVRNEHLATSDDNVLVTSTGIFHGNQVKDLQTDYIISRPGSSYRFNLSTALAPYLEDVDTMCRLNYWDCIMADYDQDRFLVMPYRLNILLLVNKQKPGYRVIPTVIRQNRVDLKQVEVSMPGGGKMYNCASENGSEMLQSALSSNNSHIYILANEVHKTGNNYYDIIDFYDKSSFAYKGSLKVKNAGEEDYLLDIESTDSCIYGLSNKRSLIKIQLR